MHRPIGSLLPLLVLPLLVLPLSCKTTQKGSAVAAAQLDQNAYVETMAKAKTGRGIDRPADKSLDEIKAGPKPSWSVDGVHTFAWGSTVHCVFADANLEKPSGQSPKFGCDIQDDSGKVVRANTKIKYGDVNPEVYNALSGSRLFWLLGSPGDYYYSVKVECMGCPPGDPWDFIKAYHRGDDAFKKTQKDVIAAAKAQQSKQVFAAATIETKFGKAMTRPDGQEGWSFYDDLVKSADQLNFGSDEANKTELAHREALTLLAAMLNHVDNQVGNQALYYCTDQDVLGDGKGCDKKDPWAVIHDLGGMMGGYRSHS